MVLSADEVLYARILHSFSLLDISSMHVGDGGESHLVSMWCGYEQPAGVKRKQVPKIPGWKKGIVGLINEEHPFFSTTPEFHCT